LPLRANANATNAPTSVDAFNAFVRLEEGGSVPMNRPQYAVHAAGEPITVEFADGVEGAPTDRFDGTDAKLLVARFDDDSRVDPTDSSALTLSPALSVFAGEDSLAAANRNVTFSIAGSGTIEDGSLSIQHTPSQSGRYAYYLVQERSDPSLEVDEAGNVSVSGQTRILGVEAVTVQRAPSDVSLANPGANREPGNAVTFDVDSNLDGEVTHVLLVYDHRTFTNQRMTAVVSDTSEQGLTTDDVTLEHSIASVDGVRDVRGSPTVLGAALGDGEVTDVTRMSGVIDFLAEGGNADSLDTEVTDNSDSLDASMVAVERGSNETTLSVDTYRNWSAGRYRYVHVAVKPNDTAMTSDTGTVRLADRESGGGGGGGGVPDRGPDFDVVPSDRGATVQIRQAAHGTTISAGVSKQVSRDGVGLQYVNVSTLTSVESARISVSELSETPPSSVPDAPADGALGYFTVETVNFPGSSVGDVSFRFTVAPDALPSGTAPEQVRIFRYHGGEWTALDAEHLGNGTYRAEASGFSTWAIGVASAGGPAGAPSFSLRGHSLSSTTVAPGETVEVSARVANDGNRTGNYTARLAVDGVSRSAESVSIAPGEEATATFDLTLEEAGTYDLAVNGRTVGTVEVVAPQTTVRTSTTTPGAGGGGGLSGPLTGLALLLAAVVVGLAVYNRYYAE
jgi:PGF-pre-PGF domain-containing protein